MIFFVLFLGLLLRLISLNQSLWLDEATTALASRLSISDFFSNFMSGDFHPPLYYLVIKYWGLLFGYSEISLRIPSVIFGLLTVYTLFLIAKEIKFKYSIVPALFIATSGLHIYYSQEARMYSLATMLVTLAVYVFLKEKWILFSLIMALIFLTDYVSIIFLASLWIYAFLVKKNKSWFVKFAWSHASLLVVFLLWLPKLLVQLKHGFEVKESALGWWNILGPVTVKNILLIPTKFMIGRISFQNDTIYAIAILAIGLIFTFSMIKAKNKLVWLWFVLSLSLGIIISFFIPTLTYFRYLFVLPAFYLLVSENTNKLLIAIILVVNLLTSGIYLSNYRFQREDWRSLAKSIGDNEIIFPSNSQKEALIYYGKEKQIKSLENFDNTNSEVFLSRYVWQIFDSVDSTRLRLIDMGYNMVLEDNYNGVVIQKYQKNNKPVQIEK